VKRKTEGGATSDPRSEALRWERWYIDLQEVKNRQECLWGTKDYLFVETTLGSWIDFLPRGKVVRIENASHYVQEDVPELVASAIANVIL
jgi:pimeloyl-ACP methyl ester carboxylesterase